jgi:Tfp pilus assembly protein PilO
VNPLYRRIGTEKRGIVLPLLIGIVVNILAYAFVVYPLGIRSAGAADRAAQAAATLRTAEREHAAAGELVAGKQRAEEELDTFYHKVLPANLVAVRRMTYGPLIDMAERSNVSYLRRSYAEDETVVAEGRLTRITIRMVFQGTYENLRNFIYELETAPEFVIVDEVALTESGEERLTLTLTLSTYFRTSDDGV